MAAIRLANASVLSSFSDTVDFVAGKASITILADGPGIPEETLERLAWLRGIGATLAPAVTETAAAGARDGEVVEVLGIDPLADANAREYSFAEEGNERTGAPDHRGAAAARPAPTHTFEENPTPPSPDAPRSPGADGSEANLFSIFSPDSILVTEAFAARQGLSVGSPLSLVTNSVEKRFRVAAVLRLAGAARAAAGSIVFLDVATAQEAFGKVGRLDRIDIVLPGSFSDADRARVLEEVSASLPPGVTAGRPERRTETVDRLVRAFRVNLAALGAIALLVGMYFVYNTLSISVLRRRADIGVVRALGASRRAVFAAFLGEGLALGAAGSALGLVLGALLAAGALRLVGGTATELYLPSAHPTLRLDPIVLGLAFLLGVATSALSALAPALEAARVDPAATMRHGSVEAARRRRTRPLAVAGSVLLVLAWVATRPGPVRGLPLFGFLSVFLVVAGVSLLTPAAVTFAASRLDGVALRLFGVEARLARANLTGSLSRTSVAVAALTMGLSMMVAVAVMVGSFRTTVATWVGQTLSSDVFIGPASGRSGPSLGRIPDEAIAAVRAVPGVDEVDPFLAFSATREGAPYTIGSGRFAFIARHGNLPLVDGRDPKRVFTEALANGEAMVSEPYAEKFHVGAGDSVELPSPRGAVRVRVAGVYTDYSNDRGTITLDRARFQGIWPLTGASTLAVTLKPGVSPEEGARRIARAVSGRFALRHPDERDAPARRPPGLRPHVRRHVRARGRRDRGRRARRLQHAHGARPREAAGDRAPARPRGLGEAREARRAVRGRRDRRPRHRARARVRRRDVARPRPRDQPPELRVDDRDALALGVPRGRARARLRDDAPRGRATGGPRGRDGRRGRAERGMREKEQKRREEERDFLEGEEKKREEERRRHGEGISEKGEWADARARRGPAPGPPCAPLLR